ncbi:MAG TPA: ABC transporter substrate-binding protein [Candidatus Binatia bacterium]|jgi:NitT/TauT family transport system substrate-binding protein|nr:ABC transporter substrate-binding protein [Candidatus Binatia bacterium]
MRGELSLRGLTISLVIAAVAFSPLVDSRADQNARMAYISDSPGSSAPYWIAKDAGLFKKYGLDVELVFINGSTRGIQSLVAGDIEFAGAVGTSAINGKLAGGDFAIVDSLVNTLPYYIIGTPKIKSPEDLKGRTLATHIPGTSADFAVRLALRKFGSDYKDIQAVMVGGAPARVAAVINGQTDFTMVTEPGKIQGEKAGMKLIIDMAKLKIPFQFTCTVASGKLIREQPKVVESMAKALAEAVHFFKNNKKETIQIMTKYTRGAKPNVLEGSWVAYKELLQEDTQPTLEGLNDTLAVQATWDPKAAKAKAEDFVDLRFVNNLKRSGFIDKLYGRTHMSRN